MTVYSVKLDAFEGPLDLLLHLINEAKVDIYDIPVAQITEQYMNYVQSMKQLELDVASEYLVMAATLLMIKSKTLLPKQEVIPLDDELYEEEEDPRDELVFKLIEYRKYKEMANEFKEFEKARNLIHMRPVAEIDSYLTEEERRDVAIKNVSLYDMLAAYQKLMTRKQLQIPQETTVHTEEYSVEERMNEILILLSKKRKNCYFHELFQSAERSQVVVTFLAILELMRTKAILCVQVENFSDIMIVRDDWKEVDNGGYEGLTSSD